MHAPLPLPAPSLTDGVVTLRAWDDGDAAIAALWGEDPEIVRWTDVPVDQTEPLAVQYIAGAAHARLARLSVALAIADATTHALLGGCDVRRPDPGDPAIGELGYLLARAARGRGVATRAAWLLTDWSFRVLAMERVQGLVHPGNPASARVLERVGFTREGLLRRFRAGARGREDRIIYSLLPGELRSVATPAGE